MKKIFLVCGVLFFLLGFINAVNAQDRTPRFEFKVVEGENVVDKRFDFEDVAPGSVLEGDVDLYLYEDVRSVFKVEIKPVSPIKDVDKKVSDWAFIEEGSVQVLTGIDDKKTLHFKVEIPEELPPGEYRFVLLSTLDDYGDQVGLDLDNVQGGAVKVTAAKGIIMNVDVPGERNYKVELQSFDQGRFDRESGFLDFNSKFFNYSNAKIYASYDLVITNGLGQEIFSQTYNAGDCVANKQGYYNLIVEGLEVNFIDKLNVEATMYYSKELGEEVERFKVGIAKLTINVIPEEEIKYAAIVLLLIVVIILFFVVRRRFYMRGAVVYKVKEGDTFESVCKRQKVDPKKVIIVNKLKKPYFLEVGQKLLLPK